MEPKAVPWYHKTDRRLLKTEIEDLQAKGIFVNNTHWTQTETFLLYQNWLNFATKNRIDEYMPVRYLNSIFEKTETAKEKKAKLLPALCDKMRNRCGAFILMQFSKCSKEGWDKFVPKLPPNTPWYHTMAFQLSLAQREKILEEGVQLMVGKFTRDEDMKIIQNWETFIDKKLEDSLEQAKRWAGIGAYAGNERKRKTATPERMAFMCALCHGLYDRTGSNVYSRFRAIVNQKAAILNDYDTVKQRISEELEEGYDSLKAEGCIAVANRIGCTPQQISDYKSAQKKNPLRKKTSKFSKDKEEQQKLIDFVDAVMQQIECATEDQAIDFPVKNISFFIIEKDLGKMSSFLYKRMWLKLRRNRHDVSDWTNKEVFYVLQSIRKQDPTHMKLIDWERVASDVHIRPVLKDSEEMRIRLYHVLYSFFKNKRSIETSVMDIPLCTALDIVMDHCRKKLPLAVEDSLNDTEFEEIGEQSQKSVEEQEQFLNWLSEQDYDTGSTGQQNGTNENEQGQCTHENDANMQNDAESSGLEDRKWKDIPMKRFITSLKRRVNVDDECINFDTVFNDDSHISSAKRLKKAWKKLQATVPTHLQTPYDKVRYLKRILRKRKAENCDQQNSELTVRQFIEQCRNSTD